MYCRSSALRKEIVRTHVVQPVARLQLLVGQEKLSCTGDKLTNSYYCFNYKSRTGGIDGTLLCGEHAAKDFLSLIGHPELSLFNPLVSDERGMRQSFGGGGGSARKWDEAAKQLYQSVNLLMISWATAPGPAIASIKLKLERFPDRPPYPSQVKAVNTIIGKDGMQRTLTQMIAELARHNRMKSYAFNRLDEILASEGIGSNFTHCSE